MQRSSTTTNSNWNWKWLNNGWESRKKKSTSFTKIWTCSNSIQEIAENVCNNKDAVLKVAEILDIDVKREDIDICHRIKRKKSRPIIARFVSHKVKRALYKQWVRLKNISFSQLFPSASALNVKSRLDFILIAKNLSKFVESTGIKASIAPDHKTVHLCLSWPNNSPRGPGFWKFNNTLLKDENYTGKICKLIPRVFERQKISMGIN